MPTQPPVFLIIGPPHHGKTLTREILAELTYLKGGSTSDVIYRFLAHRGETSVDELKKTPKDELRPKLIEAGDYLCGIIPCISEEAKDGGEIDKIVYRIPSALIRTLYMNGYNIIDGVRRIVELNDARNHLNWNGVRSLIIWVERPGVPIVQDNTELTEEYADEVVKNDGTVEDLRAKLLKILEKHFGVQDELNKPIQIVDVPAKS